MHLHAPAPLAVGAVEGAERLQHVATFADDGVAGGKVGLGQRATLTRWVTGGAHGCASSRMALRSGRKTRVTFPTSPWRCLASLRSTARVGGARVRAGADSEQHYPWAAACRRSLE